MAAAGLAAASVLRWALCRMNGRRACARFDYMDAMLWIPSSNNRTDSFSSNNRHNKHQSTPHTQQPRHQTIHPCPATFLASIPIEGLWTILRAKGLHSAIECPYGR